MEENEEKVVDLRSDTVTVPSAKMREAMAAAAVGDDVYREDPTVLKLEKKAADLLGKEAGLFFPSGTMSNQAALLTHTEPGQEIVLGKESHIFYYEVGGAARLGGLQTRQVDDSNGCPSGKEVEKAIRAEDIHYPETGLICLENTHNRAGGKAIKLKQMQKVTDTAKKQDIPIHLDGARIFNAACALDIKASRLAEPFDRVTCCLSKALGAPVGSVLAGSEAFIDRALKNRKMLGGGMRQVGVLAAAGLVSLNNINRLDEDHRLAAELAEKIKSLNWPQLNVECRNTNFVILSFESEKGAGWLQDRLKKKGFLINTYGSERIRLVTHLNVEKEDIESFVDGLREIKAEIEKL